MKHLLRLLTMMRHMSLLGDTSLELIRPQRCPRDAGHAQSEDYKELVDKGDKSVSPPERHWYHLQETCFWITGTVRSGFRGQGRGRNSGSSFTLAGALSLLGFASSCWRGAAGPGDWEAWW